MFDLIMVLLRNVGIIAILALLFSQVLFFRSALRRRNLDLKEEFLFSFFFGCIGIYGTYSGVVVNDAVANSRVIGPFVGGLIGGPFVGFFSGLIAGGHRYAINPSGFTSFACVVITPLQGFLVGYFSKSFHKTKNKWLWTLLAGALAETLHMIAVLVFSRPWEAAVKLVEVIGPPMIIANAIGISAFVIILENVLRDQERRDALRAKLALNIVNDSLAHLRLGLNIETATATAKLIMSKIPGLAAVSFTNQQTILAHVGQGDDHHCAGGELQNEATKSALKDGYTRILKNAGEIGCRDPNCSLKSAVIAPLVVEEKVIGAMKFYRDRESSITSYDTELIQGLATFFSNQIALQKIQEHRNLLQEAEFKSLQAQINPHFLFNAINTISSIVRMNSEKARELLIGLGLYYRGNMIQADTININDELNHVRAYLLIEQARFADSLEIEWNVDQDINLYIPPLSIQPLVENAIKHGVRAKKSKGKVVITVKQSGDGVVIHVKDDGIGIDPTKLESLLDESVITKSFALKNIHKRLQLKYGLESGLKISSYPDKGTDISFYIPEKRV